MQGYDVRKAMLDVARRDGDIAEGALWLAADDRPGLDPAPWLTRIDELAAELRSRCGSGGCGIRDAPLVARLLRERLRLHGGAGGDPRSHYLHTVLERGAGIPIACSALWIAVGTRAGIPVTGVNTPGHFLVRIGDLLYDTIAGDEPLDDDAAKRLIAEATGHRVERLQPLWMSRASTRDMLLRMSRNLRGLYATMEQWQAAVRAADRCIALAPDDPTERRDRGLLLWRCGQPVAALDDLRHFLDNTPADVADRADVTEIANRLRAYLN